MFNIIDMRSAWKVDLVMRKNRPFSREELARRTEQEILGVVVPTASPDTIVAKLEWAKQGSSERQLRDIVGILRVRSDSIDREYIARWVAALGLEEQTPGSTAGLGASPRARSRGAMRTSRPFFHRASADGSRLA